MTDMVRVKLENGAEATLPREFVETLPEGKIKVLGSKPATDVRGVALSDKPPVNLPPAGSSYDAMKAADLQTEADSRGLEVVGSGNDGNVLKADLVAALQAHDAELAPVLNA